MGDLQDDAEFFSQVATTTFNLLRILCKLHGLLAVLCIIFYLMANSIIFAFVLALF